MSGGRQVLPLLERIRSMGIGIDKLLPFSLVVNEKAQKCMSICATAYRVMEDIEIYNRIGDLQNETSYL